MHHTSKIACFGRQELCLRDSGSEDVGAETPQRKLHDLSMRSP